MPELTEDQAKSNYAAKYGVAVAKGIQVPAAAPRGPFFPHTERKYTFSQNIR
jgi:hypothetical protein